MNKHNTSSRNKDLLLLGFDPGTSGNKIVYGVARDGALGRPSLLLMDSHLAEVSHQSLKIYESSRITKPQPDNEAWVKSRERYYAVGFLAKKHFASSISIEGIKYEKTIPKVLAAVGVVAMKNQLGQKFDLALSLTLPYSEWEDREVLERELQEALSQFSFRGVELKVGVKFFYCIPEGGGLLLTRSKKLGPQQLSRKTVIALMFGLRDASLVQFERGVISGESKKHGMAEMIELVQKNTSGQSGPEEFEALIKTVYGAGKKIVPTKFELLAKSQREDLRQQELKKMAQVVNYARREYWRRIRGWLQERMPPTVDEIIIGGGTAEYLSPEIKEYVNDKYKGVFVSWGADLEGDVVQTFGQFTQQDCLSKRLTDVFGLFGYLQFLVKKQDQLFLAS